MRFIMSSFWDNRRMAVPGKRMFLNADKRDNIEENENREVCHVRLYQGAVQRNL